MVDCISFGMWGSSSIILIWYFPWNDEAAQDQPDI